MFKRALCLLMIFSVYFSCDNKQAESSNSFSDPVILKIGNLKDKRLSDSLYSYFTDEDIAHRHAAALAFGSIQDSTALTQLERMLIRESDSSVRKAIVYSIGQTRSLQSERILLGMLMREKDAGVTRDALEAYGKVTRHWQLVHPSFLEDTLRSEGLAWSIYRAGINGAADSTANRIAAKLIHEKHCLSTQLAAAHYFARSAKNFDQYFDEISKVALEEKSVDVRMAATLALRRIKTDASLQTLKKILDSDCDYRIKVNAIRALQTFDFNDSKTTLYKMLYDKKANVAIAASEAIKASAKPDNWIEVSNLSERIQNWRARTDLYATALMGTANPALNDEVKKQFTGSINLFEKAALITALQSHTSNFDFIEEQLLKADTPVIRTAAASALASMNSLKEFSKEYKIRFSEICKTRMPMGDPAVIGTFAATLADSSLNYRSVISDFDFLYQAKKRLSLPKDIEALQPLEAAIAYFEKRKAVTLTNEYNHPVDWVFVQTLPKNLTATIKTTRGSIRIKLLVDEAPGTVANFVKLARKDYYDQKAFHRVVPNFVIQAGCNRSDGWGSEDYSIRSEFSQRKYKTGSLGMASAGKDTEGTQWFITNSPTPHLDGRYTIFGEVIEGIEAAHLVEVGDKIIDVVIDLK
jgi:cyclophilin family peptidyl-prolyl cis-trans isomerase/HEAT repeat protein